MPLPTTFRNKFGFNLPYNIAIRNKKTFKHKYL
jgi:hypothetical protein